jgi:hypothetical protein
MRDSFPPFIAFGLYKAYSSLLGVIMEIEGLPKGHHWLTREGKLQDKPFVHQHCLRCGRNFVRQDEGEWQAIHLGIFKFQPLDDITAKNWLNQKCPGHKLRTK